MKKINSTGELPKWFNLGKYEPSSRFTARDWLIQLTLRSFAFSQPADFEFTYEELLSIKDEIIKADHPSLLYMLDLLELVEEIRKTPLSTKLENNTFWDHSHRMASPENLDRTTPIRPLTLETLLIQKCADEVAFEDGEKDESVLIPWQHLSKTQESEEDYDDPRNAPHIEIILGKKIGDEWDSPSIVVDLNAPDSILLNAFKEWLKKQRQAASDEKKSPKKPAYNWWSGYGLLPYIDLSTWSIQTGIHIPDRVMADAISGLSFGEDSLRKTVRPLANDLQNLIDSLRDLAATESS